MTQGEFFEYKRLQRKFFTNVDGTTIPFLAINPNVERDPDWQKYSFLADKYIDMLREHRKIVLSDLQ